MDLEVNLGGLKMRTPVTTASGTFGYGTEYVGALDYSKLGAVTAKGVRLDAWPGNPMPRHVEVFGGMVNAIGLQGPGVAAFVEHYVPHYVETVGAETGANAVPPMIVNIWGGSVEEYAEVAKRLTAAGAPVAAIEMNVSCPNVKAGGHTFGQDPAVLAKVVAATRAATTLPLIVKLAPNVPDFRPYVAACEDSGADALALINTIPAMVIDIETRRPVLGNRTGGLSGRCVHPAAVKAVFDVHNCSKLPLLAMGGVYEPKDAIELMLAGATAVAVGTATFTDPSTAARVCDGIADYCARQGFAAARDLTGALAL
ncbi:MAG: dihydroorotate dehydrogenase [Kiritimatiellae bacterium]|nr:dihydroorotate dehydrogenase [Kiritimatiellia bacterium]